LLGASVGPANADVLIGPNGERLPGRVVEDKDGVLVFDSDFLGRIKVQSNRARVERDPAPVTEKTRTGSQVNEIAQGSPHWASDVDVRLGADRGSLKTPEDTLDARWAISRKSDTGEFDAMIRYKYKRTDDQLKNNDWLGTVRYDRFLSSDYFATAQIIGVDELVNSSYNETGTFAIAAGWRIWEQPDKYLRIGPALGYMSLERDHQTFDGPAIGFYARSRYPLWSGAKLEWEVQALNASGGNRYAISQMRVKRALTENLYLALDWLYTWSHVPIETGVVSQWRWVLGWSFDPRRDQSP